MNEIDTAMVNENDSGTISILTVSAQSTETPENNSTVSTSVHGVEHNSTATGVTVSSLKSTASTLNVSNEEDTEKGCDNDGEMGPF